MSAFMVKIAAFIMSVYTMFMGIFYPAIDSFEPEKLQSKAPITGETVTVAGEGSFIHYEIIVADDAPETDITAAEILQKYIHKVCGEKLPIVKKSVDARPYNILIGKAAPDSIFTELAELKDEGYIIRKATSDIIISGNGARGTIYGVFEFLRQFADVHVYTKDIITTPAAQAIVIPADLNIKYEPYFEIRETEWISGKDNFYSLANQLNSNVYRNLPQSEGGTVGYIGSFCHTFTNNIVSKDVYFESHPEYFAYRSYEDTRKPTQLCLTNPQVLEIVCDEVLAMLEESYDADSDNLQIISLTQDDNYEYCECENCAKLDSEGGSQAATMITFVNAVADVVKAAGYDNCVIDTFAYQYTRKAPTNVVPRDNVIVRLCSIECCFSHALDEKGCERNEEFMADLEAWSKICNTIHIWDYTTNYAHYMGIMPNFGVIARNAQIFAEHNVTGLYEEGNYELDKCDAEFGELRCYLLSRLMFDPYMDYESEMNGFLNAYYGEAAAPYIKEFINMTIENTGRHGVMTDYDKLIRKNTYAWIYSPMTSRAVLDLKHNEIEYCNDLWENAKAAAENEEYKSRVERSELCWRFFKGVNKLCEFSRLQPISVWKAENEKLYNDAISMGVTNYCERVPITDTPDFSKTPDSWTTKK